MGIELIPKQVRKLYEIHEWKHACAILAQDFPNEWNDIIQLLGQFRLCKSWIDTAGGSKSELSKALDGFLFARGWEEKHFATSVQVDDKLTESPTHKVGCYKNRVALEIE